MRPRPPDPRLFGRDLTTEERQIVRLLAQGQNVHELEAQLHYGHSSIAKRLHRIQSKLGARTIAQAMYLWGRVSPETWDRRLEDRLRDRADGVAGDGE